MNKLRNLIERRAVLLKEISEIGKQISQLEQEQAKNGSYQQAINYHQK